MSHPAPPPCPITGKPAVRFIQWVSVAFLRGLWGKGLGVDIGPLPEGLDRFGVWETEEGLLFFDPMIAGGEAFYRAFYARIAAHDKLESGGSGRQEFLIAAGHVPEGAAVLDVGCGRGGFRPYAPGRRYVGLDPVFGVDDVTGTIRAETIEAHAETHAGVYDVVCAFQVVEHVEQPLAFARAMARCLRAGGLLMVGVPYWPSPMSRIPNLPLNAPPHHLSWWSDGSLAALARELGLSVRSIDRVPWGKHDSVLWWMSRLSPVQCTDVFYKHAASWHASLAWSYAAGTLTGKLFKAPASAEAASLLLVAEKPAES